MKDSNRKAMFAKKGEFRPDGVYSRSEINAVKKKYGVQGTTKFLGGKCQHCGGNDATFKHKRANGSVSEVRCIRCRTVAGM